MASEREKSVLCDLLLLVDCNVPLRVIRAWTEKQKILAEQWAVKTYLRASDNPVRVPPRPAFLDQYIRGASHDR